MADLEGAGVLEELLLQQRVLVDSGVYPLVENARLGDLLAVFQSTILALQHREPSFWQLQVVQFIRNVLKTRVGRCIDDAVGSTELQDPMDVVARVKEQIQTSEALETSLQQVQSDVEKEVARLTEILHTDKENLTVQDGDEHFLAKFWETLHSVVESREKQPKSDEEREAEGLETEFESCSFENLTFEDDFNDMSRSAMRVVFNVMNQVEDAAQFSELYWAVVDFMGSHLETGELFLGRQEVCENDNARCVAVVDCFRVLCTLLYKVIRHWVYFSTEQFAQLIHSTFRLLTIYAKAETEVEAKWISPFMMLSLVDDDPLRWFKLWLLNAPSLHQLFVAIDESGFVADVLQHLSRLRPLSPIKSSNPSVDAIEKRITQCEFHEELETRYEHLGITAIDALVLSIAALIVTDSHEDAIVPYNARWVEVISNSVTTYLHTTHFDDLLVALIYQVVDQLKATVDFTMALNSPDDECPPQLTRLMRRLQLLRCCLSTQFASSSLFLLKENPLVQFIKETLTIHTQGCCMDSCNAEDTCCVVFQLVLSLVSSVPAMLQCSDMLSKLRLLKLDDESLFVRDLLCSDKEVLGSCSFLEKQLCYNFEFIGGSCEKLHQYELCDFDGHFRQNNTINKKSSGVEKSVEKAISDFAFTLQNKILQVIKDGVESGSATPMNFVLISQASWELIIDLEAGTIAPPSFVTCRSAAGFTEIFATVIYNLVMSKRSRLELPVNSNTDGLDMSTVTSSLHNDKVFFPTDSARKLMNRWYKNYTHWLSLPSSPTLLHCIVKNFGKAAMDCFPVTILMILYPTYEEADILCFLSQCIHTPSAPFLWPTTDVDGDIPTRSAISIGEGVEIIMEREFPEVRYQSDAIFYSIDPYMPVRAGFASH
ncbi:hypothetical protein PHMEG_0007012 [Phytophthora megakarya]|uniref:Uncharacterized protein n=1 Tax=Phytophthora megakarya TaxID=4795 RepID=A0A225WME6_9STRA|nr:hypothetical protein PHMEG_0007012 [Phytophthora megakarya]